MSGNSGDVEGECFGGDEALATPPLPSLCHSLYGCKLANNLIPNDLKILCGWGWECNHTLDCFFFFFLIQNVQFRKAV